MKPGDPVEVNDVWASNGALKPPSKAWFKGYAFVSSSNGTTKVKRTSGTFEGVVLNYPDRDVRPEETK